MPKMANRVQETTTTGGTGTLTLDGAVTGYLTFASSFTAGDSLFYTIDNGIGDWEIGIGTLVTTSTLSRATVIASSNNGGLVNFGSGTKRVFCTAPTRSLVPDQDSKSGYVLSTDGTDPIWTQALNGVSVGGTTAAAGAFTTLSASSTVSGSGFSTYLASPPAIGGTVAAAGSFTTLSASSTVSGTGFSTYLASPPAIGGTAPAAGAFTTLSSTGNTTLGDASGDTLTINAGTTTFAGTGQRITGDFSNATLANRLAFQTSTVNGSTTIMAIPNGSGTNAQLLLRSSSTVADDSFGQVVLVGGIDFRIASGISGTGTYLPMTFYTGNAERVRIDTSGNVGIGTSSLSSQSRLTIYSDATPSSTYYDLWLRGGNAGVGNDGGGIAFSTAAASAIANPSLAATAIRSLNGYGSESNGEQGDLAFYTNRRTGANTYSGLTERLRIDYSGNVGIGTVTKPSSVALNIIGKDKTTGDATPLFNFKQASTDTSLYYAGARFEFSNSSATNNNFTVLSFLGANGYDLAAIWTVNKAHTAGVVTGDLVFGTTNAGSASTERLRIDSAGTLLLRQSSNAANNSVSFNTTIQNALTLDASGRLLVTAATGLGYGTGAGGAVTQATSKSTGVTLNTPSGSVTTHNQSMNNGDIQTFLLTNSLIGSNDVVFVNADGNGSYRIETSTVVSGGAYIRITNISGSTLAEAIKINFVVIKGSTS